MRDQLRALLVTLHLLAVILLSLPAPAGMTETSLQEENLQSSFKAWSETAQSLGLALSPQDVQDLSWTWGNRVLDVRTQVLRPFQPYYKYAGTNQRWQMFGYLNRNPGRIEVATCDKKNKKLCEEEDWQWRFVMGSDEFDWLRPTIDQERIRAIVSSFAWKKRSSHYHAIGRWLATQAARDFPDARFVRTRMGRLEIPSAEKMRELRGQCQTDSECQSPLPVGSFYWDKVFPIQVPG